jgi:transcription initiation factor TFIIB
LSFHALPFKGATTLLQGVKMVAKCPECGCTRIIHDRESGEAVCASCGLVIEEWSYDRGPEWRSLDPEGYGEKSRAGMPEQLSIHDKGLATMIDSSGEDAQGKKLPSSTYFQMKRLRKWHIRSRVQSSAERNLSQAMAELDRLCEQMRIPHSVKEEAAYVYRKAFEKGLVRGREINALVPASLYASCRRAGLPRTIQEVAAASLVEEKAVRRSYRLILMELDLQVPLSDPIAYTSKIASTLNISGKSQGLAVEILKLAKERRVSLGSHPAAMAAAALYIACELNEEAKNQADISYAAGITDVTLRNNIKRLKGCLKPISGERVEPKS